MNRLPGKLITLATLLILFHVSFTVAAIVERPLDDFLSRQGTYCVDDGAGACRLYVPPDPNFLGWSGGWTDDGQRLLASIDYAGLADAYPNGNSPMIQGKVTERILRDGRALVTVKLHTRGANAWVAGIDPTGDILDQIAGAETLFGHRPSDVLAGAEQALANTHLRARFINSAPGAELPDLVELLVSDARDDDLRSLHFLAHAEGPLTEEFGVPEGTPGIALVVRPKPFFASMNHERRKQGPLADAFPQALIHLHRARVHDTPEPGSLGLTLAAATGLVAFAFRSKAKRRGGIRVW